MMDREKLRAILKKHKKWIDFEDDGERADLGHADLRHAYLEEADLTQADLRHAITEQIVGKSVISVQVDTSRPNNTISYWIDLEIWTTGCFQGTLEELRESIEKTHKENDFLRDRYYRVIDFILHEADEDKRKKL